MKFAKVFSAQPEYLRGRIVNVEVDISRGLHAFSIVGMASKSVDEARDRVGSAIKNSGFTSAQSLRLLSPLTRRQNIGRRSFLNYRSISAKLILMLAARVIFMMRRPLSILP